MWRSVRSKKRRSKRGSPSHHSREVSMLSYDRSEERLARLPNREGPTPASSFGTASLLHLFIALVACRRQQKLTSPFAAPTRIGTRSERVQRGDSTHGPSARSEHASTVRACERALNIRAIGKCVYVAEGWDFVFPASDRRPSVFRQSVSSIDGR